MKRILIPLLIFILFTSVGFSVSIYPSSEDLGVISPGEIYSNSFTLIHTSGESVEISSTSPYVFLSKSEFIFDEQGTETIAYSLVIPSSIQAGTHTITITADSNKTDSLLLVTFKIEDTTEVESDASEILISYDGVVCPGNAILIKVFDSNGKAVNGQAQLYSSTGNLEESLDVINGYTGTVIIPRTETNYVLIKATVDGFDTKSLTLSIPPTCSAYELETGKQLELLLSVRNYSLSGGKIKVVPMVKTNMTTITGANCIFSGTTQGLVKSIEGGFCEIEFIQSGIYTLWAEKSGYLTSGTITVNISAETIVAPPAPVKDTVKLGLLVNNMENYGDKIFKGDKIIIKIMNYDNTIRKISTFADIIPPSNQQFANAIIDGMGTEFQINEFGSFSITIPATDDTYSATLPFTVEKQKISTPVIIGIVAFILIVIIIFYFLLRGKGKKVGYSTAPNLDAEEFLGKG